MGFIASKVLANLYLVIPLVAIPVTLLREVEGHAVIVIVGGIHHGLASLDALTGGVLLDS